jgi:hypothetical protein
MYFGAAPRRACGRAVGCAGARAGAPAWAASASGYNRRSERAGVPITRMRVCLRACAVSSAWHLRPVRRHVRPSSRGGRGPHARSVHGRSIYATNVHALPESLGRCKLLEELCVPRPPPPPPCAIAAVPARRCCARRCRAGRWAAPRGVGCGDGGVAGRRPTAEPRARTAGARGRPARVRGGPDTARRGRTVGAQGRVQLRARGAAGGGRLAEPQDTVSATAAALTRPRRCADARSGGSSARAPDVHDWVHVCAHMCVCSTSCMCVQTYARMRRMLSSVRVCACVCVRVGSRRAAEGCDLHLGITVDMCIYMCAHMYMCAYARMYTCMRALVECIPA